MASKTVKRVGTLSNDEKIYIAEHFLWYDNEWIASKLKISITYVNSYVDRLRHKGKQQKIDSEQRQEAKKEVQKKFKTPKDIATVMTQESSSIPYRPKKYSSEFKTGK